MIQILYTDEELCVAVKPAGVEAQSAKRFAPDMVSEIKKYLVINKLCTPGREPYVGVIHRLDKPVSGVMVYARTKSAAAGLSAQLREGRIRKVYRAVVCGKPGKNVDNLVDYLKKDVNGNYSHVVDKETAGAKRAELSYRLLDSQMTESGVASLLEIELKTGRHHQIRVQTAARGFPIWGDQKYNANSCGSEMLALCACAVSFEHPVSRRQMSFSFMPGSGAFALFSSSGQ